jgi:hypothetical protein
MSRVFPSTIGAHLVRVESSETIYARYDGELRVEEMSALLDVVHEISGEEGYVIVLQDLTNLTTLSSAARKMMAQDPRARRVVSVINIGVSFHIRVLFGMVVMLSRMMNQPVPALHYVATEAEGRTTLEAERARLGGQHVKAS